MEIKEINIIDAGKYVDKKVKIGVWLTDRRSSGKIIFLQLRDGTAFFQGVVVKGTVSDEIFEQARSLKQESSFYELERFTKIKEAILDTKLQ